MATLSSLDRRRRLPALSLSLSLSLSPLACLATLLPPSLSDRLSSSLVENHGENEGEKLEICLAIPRGWMYERRFAAFTGLPGWTPIEFFLRDGNRG